ncbi:hypothetical protein ACWDYJ_28475 [Streptomyces sp. NPDC003042]
MREQLAAAVRAFPGVAVPSAANADAAPAERQAAGAELNLLAMGLVPAFTAVAVVDTLARSTAERLRRVRNAEAGGGAARAGAPGGPHGDVGGGADGDGAGVRDRAGRPDRVQRGHATGTAAPVVLPLVYAVVVGVARSP